MAQFFLLNSQDLDLNGNKTFYFRWKFIRWLRAHQNEYWNIVPMNHGIPKGELDILFTWTDKNKQTFFFSLSKVLGKYFLLSLSFFLFHMLDKNNSYTLNSHIVNLIFKWFMLETFFPPFFRGLVIQQQKWKILYNADHIFFANIRFLLEQFKVYDFFSYFFVLIICDESSLWAIFQNIPNFRLEAKINHVIYTSTSIIFA